MAAADLYQSNGALGVLIFFVTVAITYLVRELAEARRQVKQLTDASLAMLAKTQDRDAEELRRFRDQEGKPR